MSDGYSFHARNLSPVFKECSTHYEHCYALDTLKHSATNQTFTAVYKDFYCYRMN